MNNKLYKDKEIQKVYDIETFTKPSIFLKGIGRYCEVCNKHLFGRQRKTCSKKCNDIKSWHKKRNDNRITSLHANISLNPILENNQEYRIISIYLKRGVIEHLRITKESKELWNQLEKIANFRDINQSLEIMN